MMLDRSILQMLKEEISDGLKAQQALNMILRHGIPDGDYIRVPKDIYDQANKFYTGEKE